MNDHLEHLMRVHGAWHLVKLMWGSLPERACHG
jgi:hypothetical protein